MTPEIPPREGWLPDDDQLIEPLAFDFGLKRRSFVQVLATGLLVAASVPPGLAQRAGGRGGGGAPRPVSARIHLGKDGVITVLSGKVEVGQGVRAELTQAAAEELRVAADQVQLVLADTRRVPDDGNTAGSRSTPATVPAVRQAAAAARELLAGIAAERWGVEPSSLEVRGGNIVHAPSRRSVSYGELAQMEDLPQRFSQPPPSGLALTDVKQWRVLGTPVPRPNGRDLVTGAHRFPSDLRRPGMLYGKVLRAPSFGAKLSGVDLGPVREMKDVAVVQDGGFVGVAAPTTVRAQEAIELVAKHARWETAPHPSSRELFEHLRKRASGGVPESPFAEELAAAHKVLRQTYHVPYVQHAPMETRVAVAEWQDQSVTVWTGTQNPFGYAGELARAFRLSNDQVRVIVPDTGGGFGGKHTGEAAVEAARLAQAAGKPVCLKWTREEEFTWAYFRPAAVMDVAASLDAKGALTSWFFVNINAGRSAIDTPYRAGRARSQSVNSEAPLRQGSYRALASTANNFARESFMDELAAAAGADPLEFRLAHLESGRLRDVLMAAADRFGWRARRERKEPGVGIGLACGTEKGSFVATCAEVAIAGEGKRPKVRRLCTVFECGAIINPDNLRAQVEGCLLMGLGPVLREEMRFAEGKMLNAHFGGYDVPRLSDVPELDIHLLNRTDLPSLGAGETPIIGVAPAIANAICNATGVRHRTLPLAPDEPQA